MMRQVVTVFRMSLGVGNGRLSLTFMFFDMNKFWQITKYIYLDM